MLLIDWLGLVAPCVESLVSHGAGQIGSNLAVNRTQVRQGPAGCHHAARGQGNDQAEQQRRPSDTGGTSGAGWALFMASHTKKDGRQPPRLTTRAASDPST